MNRCSFFEEYLDRFQIDPANRHRLLGVSLQKEVEFAFETKFKNGNVAFANYLNHHEWSHKPYRQNLQQVLCLEVLGPAASEDVVQAFAAHLDNIVRRRGLPSQISDLASFAVKVREPLESVGLDDHAFQSNDINLLPAVERDSTTLPELLKRLARDADKAAPLVAVSMAKWGTGLIQAGRGGQPFVPPPQYQQQPAYSNS